jgi:CheY-like chemotaxis protein
MLAAEPGSRPLVLVVEDEALVRMTLVDILEDAGFRVIEAFHADEALRVVKTVSGIQAIVTDVEMPRGSINGFELARQIIADHQDINVVITSGRATPEPNSLPKGALFIEKPAPPTILVQVLRTLVASTRANRAK